MVQCMGLRSLISTGLLVVSMAGQAQTITTQADIKDAFQIAIKEQRIPHKSYVGISYKNKPYDDCMDYDFFVQGHRVTLYYCFDYIPDKVIVEWDDFTKWTQNQRELLHKTLISPSPVLKQ